MRKTISRRTALKTGAAVVGASFIGGRASAAEFNMKYGNDLPAAHPINTRAREAVEAIKAATNGRLEIEIFPNSQLGSSHRHAQPGALGRDRHLHHRLADRERGADRGDPAASRSRSRPSTRSGPRSTAISARHMRQPIGTAST